MTKEHAVQRTFDLSIPCTCSMPHFCNRYHGLPESTLKEKLNPQREALYAEYNRLYPFTDMINSSRRVDVFRALLAPFNTY